MNSKYKKTVGLALELGELGHVIEAARLVIDLLRYQGWHDDHDAEEAPRAASATLALVGRRLRDICRVIRGSQDVSTIHARHNDAEPDDGDDIYLTGKKRR